LTGVTATLTPRAATRELVERQVHLESVTAFPEASVLVLEGEAGIGKTCLWRAAVEKTAEWLVRKSIDAGRPDKC
jgi:tRNA A37 threonylcarbamoyladenosine biosynthesis protein TsaE